MGQIADLHGIIYQQRHGTDVRTVECFADDAAANGITIQTDQQIEQCCAVTHQNVLFAVQSAQNLLRKIERIVLPLLIGKARVELQIVQCQSLFLRQRAGCADEHVGLCGEERRENQIMFSDDFAQNGFIVVVQIEHAHLTAQLRNILNDLVGLRLSDTEIVFLSAVFFQQFHKGFHGKGIVLGRHAKLMLDRGRAKIFLFDEFYLSQHLPSISQKLFSLRSQSHTPVGAVKNGQPNFLLQLSDGIRQAGL